MNCVRGAGVADRPRAEAGAGLVEALVALIVVAVGLLAVASIGRAAQSTARLAAARTAQVVAAQQVLEALHGRGAPLASDGVDTVTVGSAQLAVTTTVASPLPGLIEVWVRVDPHLAAPALEIATRLARGE